MFICFRNPAGYCFVDLPDSAAAQLALHQLNGKNIPGTAPVSNKQNTVPDMLSLLIMWYIIAIKYSDFTLSVFLEPKIQTEPCQLQSES